MEVGEEDWKPLYRSQGGREVETGQEYAEVVYVPNTIAFAKNAPTYRYLAIRELVRQAVLPGMEDTHSQLALPFATVVCAGRTYRGEGDSHEPRRRWRRADSVAL